MTAITCEGLEVRLRPGDVRWKGNPRTVRPAEHRILVTLLRNTGRVLSREEISPGASPRTVDSHVARLRRAVPELRDALISVRRIGYRFDPSRLP